MDHDAHSGAKFSDGDLDVSNNGSNDEYYIVEDKPEEEDDPDELRDPEEDPEEVPDEEENPDEDVVIDEAQDDIQADEEDPEEDDEEDLEEDPEDEVPEENHDHDVNLEDDVFVEDDLVEEDPEEEVPDDDNADDEVSDVIDPSNAHEPTIDLHIDPLVHLRYRVDSLEDECSELRREVIKIRAENTGIRELAYRSYYGMQDLQQSYDRLQREMR